MGVAVSASQSTELRCGVETHDCAYRRMWVELRTVLDGDLNSVPARSTPSARQANHSRRYHAERLMATMDHIEAEAGS
jgi:hypothetical protein